MIQIDMPIPTNCLDCPACNEYLMCAIPCDGRGFGENDVRDFSQNRPEWCPMKEQEPVEPIAIKQEMFDEFYGAVSCCPKCDCMWVMYRENDMHFCPECGQAVKWE